MKLNPELQRVRYSLKLPELRTVWLFWGLMTPLLVVNAFFLENILSFLFVLVLVLGLGAFITLKAYKLATRNLDQTISAGRLESIIINLEDAVIAYDSNFQILIFNHSAESMFGIKKENVIGQTIGPERVSEQGFGLITQTLFPSLAPSVVTRSRSNQYPQVVDITFTEPVRNFRVSTDRILNKNNQPMGFVKVIKDRTREVTLIQSKSEFVSVAAHQLRTPLSAINWTFQGLTKNEFLTDEDKALLQNGLQATGNLLKTVEDLLSTAEIEEGRFGYKLAETDLVKFIDTILSNAQVIAKKFGIQIFFDKSNLTELKVSVDQSKLALALSNLIDNAMKYNSQNGSVTVKLSQLTDKPYVQISVKDTGVGIPPGDVGRLFKKFYRASNAKKVRTDGSGLGLYIAKNIITQHGGSIWLESTLGRGTVFYFTLPTDPSLIPNSETPLAT